MRAGVQTYVPPVVEAGYLLSLFRPLLGMHWKRNVVGGPKKRKNGNRVLGEYVLLSTLMVSRLAGSPLRRVIVTGCVECKGLCFARMWFFCLLTALRSGAAYLKVEG